MEKRRENLKLLLSKKIAYTHGGIFHSDDVFSAALIKLYNSDVKIVRINEIFQDISDNFLVFDIGGGAYDHHQDTSEIRPNNVPYAAFGLLWRDLGSEFVDTEFVELFDKEFVQMIDNTDNTGISNPVSSLINGFLGEWSEESNLDERFVEAVEFAKGILQRKFKHYNALKEASNYVKSVIKYGVQERDDFNGILLLDAKLPWVETVVSYNLNLEDKSKMIKFVVFPGDRNPWNAQVVPKGLETTEALVDFPKSWGSLRNTELQKESGLKSAVFCHKALFLFCANDLSDAVRACEIAINKSR